MGNDESVRVLHSPIVKIGPQDRAVVPGGWFDSGKRRVESSRERLGYSHAGTSSAQYDTQTNHYSFYRTSRSLLPNQYWTLYKNTPDVRACIDSIVRRVATWDWHIRPAVDPHDEAEYSRVSEQCVAARDFLAVPNEDGETWQELMTAMVTDLLVYDAGVLELVKNGSDDLSEITSWLGSECFPVVDEHGRLLHYDQESEDETSPTKQIPSDDICYFQLFKNNRSTLGLPLLESIINECVTCILADEHAMLALDADEIPPGLLVLGGVSGPAAERARADLQSMRGKDHRIRVVTSPQPQGIEAKWVELRHTPKDLELRTVVDGIRRIIWRVFGVTPVELGETEGIPRASAEVQMDVASSHLITPILELIQARLNAQIIPLLVPDSSKVYFEFDRKAPSSAAEQLDDAKRAEVLLRNGVLTINEVRSEIGKLPVEGGDAPFLITAMGPIPLTQVANGIPQDYVDSVSEAAGDVDERSHAHQKSHSTHCALSHSETVDRDRWPLGKDWKNQILTRAGTGADKWLPSDWQLEDKFKNVRTVSLDILADIVSDYTKAATELYLETADEVSAIVRSAYNGTGMSIMDAALAKRRVTSAFDALAARWRLRCEPYYYQASELGYKAAEEWLEALPNYDHDRAAENYLTEAMAWLNDPKGLIGTLRQKITLIIDRAASFQRSRIDDIDSASEMIDVVDTVDAEFAVAAHRIDHWSGKMVPVATLAAVQSTTSTVVTQLTSDGGFEKAVVWLYEWVASNGKTCQTCAFEGGAGYRRLDQANVLPGQGTICGANCRCVLVFWTQDEVNSGAAISLTDLPANPPGAIPPPLPSY